MRWFTTIDVIFLQFVSRLRRWCYGRMVCNKDAYDDNFFIQSSELAVAGRPLNDYQVQIPLSRDLVLPESLNPNEDLRTAERSRPSAEQIAAQKGSGKFLSLVASALTASLPKNAAVVICNLTPYVEEMGMAVTWLQGVSVLVHHELCLDNIIYANQIV